MTRQFLVYLGVGVVSALVDLDISRIPTLEASALHALLDHSGEELEVLNLNGLKELEEADMEQLAEKTPRLRVVDLGFCRGVNDFTIKAMMESDRLGSLKEIKLWGCNHVQGKWEGINASGKHHSNLRIYGIESYDVS